MLDPLGTLLKTTREQGWRLSTESSYMCPVLVKEDYKMWPVSTGWCRARVNEHGALCDHIVSPSINAFLNCSDSTVDLAESSVPYNYINELVYDKTNEVIRQLPQNYVLAKKYGSRWIFDPNRSCEYKLAEAVFYLFMHDYDARYGTPEYVMQTLKNKGIPVQGN